MRTASDDEDGRLVLVVVRVHLAASYGTRAGHCFLEAGFGRLGFPIPRTVPTLDAAVAWIALRLRTSH